MTLGKVYRVRVCTCVSACVSLCVRVCLQVCLCVCMCVRVCLGTCGAEVSGPDNTSLQAAFGVAAMSSH